MDVTLYLRPVCEKRLSSLKKVMLKSVRSERKVLLESDVWLSLQPAQKIAEVLQKNCENFSSSNQEKFC